MKAEELRVALDGERPLCPTLHNWIKEVLYPEFRLTGGKTVWLETDEVVHALDADTVEQAISDLEYLNYRVRESNDRSRVSIDLPEQHLPYRFIAGINNGGLS